MTRPFLIRGMLVGIFAGLLAVGFARLFGEPQITRAIDFEGHLAQLAGEPEEAEVVSRAVQSTIGLITGVVIYGVAIGGIFGLLCAYAQGRMGRLGVRLSTLLVAGACFLTVAVIPNLKYPANPPSVGDPDTIVRRSLLYVMLIATSIAALVISVTVGRRLANRWGAWNAPLASGALFILIAALAMFAFPAINEVPEGFPAVALWRFRIASLAMQFILWGTLGLAFGYLTERALSASAARPSQPPRHAAAPAR